MGHKTPNFKYSKISLQSWPKPLYIFLSSPLSLLILFSLFLKMAETPLKRQRDETLEVEEDPKRPKPYSQILSLLEEEEQDPNQDFSSILTTLERELSPGTEHDPNPTPSSGEEEEEGERVMRHLLEASDDELGLPNIADGGYGEAVVDGGDEFGFEVCNGMWELEDEAANYYTLLQSELFM